MELRDYQKECLAAIPDSGRHLIQMATGLGKTVVFSRIPRRGRMLILSHRDELVLQPLKFFDCSTAVEKAEHRSHGEEVVSASVQSLARRYRYFAPDAFDVIVIDEAHHAAAKSYRNLTDYFKPRLLLGFTATPNRNDGAGLDAVFDDIVFERDLEWGIRNGWLSDIYAVRVNIGYDLSGVASRLGDYATDELDRAVNIESANKAVAQAYRDHAKGRTVIFCASVDHARKLAALIPGAEPVVGGEDRTEKLERFRRGETRCLTNCMVLTEGTDLPMIETVMIARPTQNESLYVQMVGRGTRLYEGKERLTLIDLVGASRLPVCTAPSLIGADADMLEPRDRALLSDDLFNLPDRITRIMDSPEYWIRNIELVDLWAKKKKYNLHGVNFFRTAKGALVLSKPRIRIEAPNKLGQVYWNGGYKPYQKVLDEVYLYLKSNHSDISMLWDGRKVHSSWGRERATDKQKDIIRRARINPDRLNKEQAACVLTRLFMGRNAI